MDMEGPCVRVEPESGALKGPSSQSSWESYDAK